MFNGRFPVSVLIVPGPGQLQVAAEYAGQLVFVTVNSDKKDGEPVLNFFGVKPDSEFPVVCPCVSSRGAPQLSVCRGIQRGEGS